MQIIIKNRLGGATDEVIEDVKIKIPELIVALWEAPPSKARRFFAKPADKPTTDHVQQVLNTAILSFKNICFTPYYGKAISGLTLTSNNRYWTGLIIDEKEYFKHHAKKVGLVDQLVEKYATPCQATIPISIPEPRPADEVNPVYAAKPFVKTEPKKEISSSLSKNKADNLNLFFHAILGIAVTAVCFAFGLNWPFSLVVVILSNFAIFFARAHFEAQSKNAHSHKMHPSEVPKANLAGHSSKALAKLPIPDNISLLFSEKKTNAPLPMIPEVSPDLEESSTPKKVAKV